MEHFYCSHQTQQDPRDIIPKIYRSDDFDLQYVLKHKNAMPVIDNKRKAEEGALVPVKKPRNELVATDVNNRIVQAVSKSNKNNGGPRAYLF